MEGHMTAPAASRLSAWLGRAPWAYETSRVQAVGFDFCVQVMDPVLGLFLDEAWGAMTVPGDATHRYSLVDWGPDRRQRYVLCFDDQVVRRSNAPSHALRTLFWHVNKQVVENAHSYELLHAAAAEHKGRAVVVPAP